MSDLITTRSKTKALPRFALGLFAVCALAANTVAQAQTATSKPKGPWTVSLGLSAGSGPAYIGSDETVELVAPSVEVEYRTQNWGSIGLSARTRGLAWMPIDKKDYSFGFVLGYDSGRTDKEKGTAFKPGSVRLRGMGEIKPSFEFGVIGSAVIGIPITLQIMNGLSDGKTNANDFSLDGHGGTRINLGAEIPWKISDALTFSIGPELTWGDDKYNQAYFGVTEAQASRTQFRQYKAGSGINALGLNLGLRYQLDKSWSLSLGANYTQLRGDAENSPIVQKKNQTSAFVGFDYAF